VEQFARFCINTTAGAGGIFDVASEWGLDEAREDLGVTLGTYGLTGGPYLVIPFLGPSNVRDLAGRVGDGFLDPVFYTGAVISHDDTAFAVSAGAKVLEAVQTRYELDPAIETSRKSSLDAYLFVQNAYYQSRNGRIRDGMAPDTPSSPEDGGSEEDKLSFDDE
jgi:phospholipid-binding lipoprotein MlaA